MILRCDKTTEVSVFSTMVRRSSNSLKFGSISYQICFLRVHQFTLDRSVFLFLSNSHNGVAQEAQRHVSTVAHSWHRVCPSVTCLIRRRAYAPVIDVASVKKNFTPYVFSESSYQSVLPRKLTGVLSFKTCI